MRIETRIMLAAAVCGVAGALSTLGATRIMSVYVESFAELQKQAAVGAGAFQAPMLAALPMMMTGGFLENRSSSEARTKFGLLFSRKEYSVMPMSWMRVASKCS